MENISYPNDIAKVCRICFELKTDSCSLFTKKGHCSIYEKLVEDAKLNVHINDGGPASICSHCLDELYVFVNFLDKCKRANEIFLQYKENLYDTNNADSSCNNTPINTNEKGTDNNETEECNQQKAQHVDSQILSKSPTKASHTCQFCYKVFTRKFNYKLHLLRHSGEREWACAACGAGTLTRALALRHCAARARRPCPAPACGKTFTSITNLNTHIRKHNGERPFSCGECGKTFRSKNTLNDHMRIHTGVKPYMCSECGKTFATNKLSAHMRTHAPLARAHACAACGRRVASARALRLHARTHAAPARSHACAACPARYAHKQSLNKHLRSRHGLKTS